MAVVVPSQSQVGRLSFSARYAASGGAPDTVANAVLVGLCEQGPLRQFFSTAYPNDPEMLDAWAAAGGMISVQASGLVPVASFVRDGDNKPTLSLTAGGAGAPVSIRCALSYSASR